MRMMRWTGYALLVVMNLAACGGSDARGAAGWAGTVETLANGAVLVSNPEQGLWAEGEEWQLVEELRIGSATVEGPELFGQVAAIEVDPLGRIWVADAQASEIRIFDAEGRSVRTVGRKGGGPGEFERITGMDWHPDGTLWVMDTGNSRFAVFDTAGTFVTSHLRPAGFMMIPWRGGVDTAGRVYDVGLAEEADGPGRYALIRYNEEMQPADTFLIPEYEREEYMLRNPAGLPMMAIPVPFAPSQTWQLSMAGDLWIGTTDRYRLHRLNHSGDTLGVVEREFTPVAVTGAEVDEMLDNYSDFTEQGGRIDHSRIPDTKPAFEGFLTDDEGYLWVVPHQDADAPSARDIFDPEGRYLGRVPMDIQLSSYPVSMIRGIHVYTVVRDELDVPYVVRLRIEGREGSGP